MNRENGMPHCLCIVEQSANSAKRRLSTQDEIPIFNLPWEIRLRTDIKKRNALLSRRSNFCSLLREIYRKLRTRILTHSRNLKMNLSPPHPRVGGGTPRPFP